MPGLSHFSRVQLFVTLWAVARQAPLSMGFSRLENPGMLEWVAVSCSRRWWIKCSQMPFQFLALHDSLLTSVLKTQTDGPVENVLPSLQHQNARLVSKILSVHSSDSVPLLLHPGCSPIILLPVTVMHCVHPHSFFLNWKSCQKSHASKLGELERKLVLPAMWETWVFDPWVGKIPWRSERLPTPVFSPGEFYRLCGPWVTELDTTKWLSPSQLKHGFKEIKSEMYEVRLPCWLSGKNLSASAGQEDPLEK